MVWAREAGADVLSWKGLGARSGGSQGGEEGGHGEGCQKVPVVSIGTLGGTVGVAPGGHSREAQMGELWRMLVACTWGRRGQEEWLPGLRAEPPRS